VETPGGADPRRRTAAQTPERGTQARTRVALHVGPAEMHVICSVMWRSCSGINWRELPAVSCNGAWQGLATLGGAVMP